MARAPRPVLTSSGTCRDAKAVVPNNAADLPDGVAGGLLVTVAGNVSFVTAGGTQRDYLAVPAWTVIPIRTRRVRSTGTTATIDALYY